MVWQDLKPKKSFKDFFKPPESFFAQALQRHRERASYLSGELANMISLAKAIPGLLAPKLPVRHPLTHGGPACRA